MRANYLFLAAALAMLVCLVSAVFFMEHYDVKPHTWGPQGVEFAEWHRVWSARRDLYIWVGTSSFVAAVILGSIGLLFNARKSNSHLISRLD